MLGGWTMKTYECKVTITETHYIYVDADTKDKAKEYLRKSSSKGKETHKEKLNNPSLLQKLINKLMFYKKN